MTDAISRSTVIDQIAEFLGPKGLDEWEVMVAIRYIIENAPTLDVAPVVRCYECKYRCTQTCPMYHTEICLDDLDGFDSYDTDRTDDDGFCHLGARMDGEAE